MQWRIHLLTIKNSPIVRFYIFGCHFEHIYTEEIWKRNKGGLKLKLDFLAYTRYNPFIQNYLKLTIQNISKYKDLLHIHYYSERQRLREKKWIFSILWKKLFGNITNIFCYGKVHWLTIGWYSSLTRHNNYIFNFFFLPWQHFIQIVVFYLIDFLIINQLLHGLVPISYEIDHVITLHGINEEMYELLPLHINSSVRSIFVLAIITTG